MTPLDSALAAWIAFHAELGIDVESLLLPPATPAELDAAERELGFELPPDLRDLYLIADGQLDPWESVAFTGDYAPLFGNYDFLPLERALAEYAFQLELHEDRPPPDENGWNGMDVRPGDPVDDVYWQPGWLPFAWGDANGYVVDLVPPRGGTIGQVVLSGADEQERRVLAPSVTALLARASERLDPDEPHRYERSDGVGGGDEGSSTYFDMDWTNEPHVPPTAEQLAEWNAISEAWNAARERDRRRFASGSTPCSSIPPNAGRCSACSTIRAA